MRRVLQAIRPLAIEFAPLLVFWALLYTIDLRTAIGVGVALMVADAAWRRATGRPMNAIYLLSAGLTVVFGLIDVFAQTPFMLKYEDVITSCVIAGAFALGTRGETSMIQRMAQAQGAEVPDNPATRLFFKAFTWVWACYFLAKAGVYLWMGEIMAMDRALVLRPIVGYASLAAMMLLSWQARPIFGVARRLGLLPARAEPAAE